MNIFEKLPTWINSETILIYIALSSFAAIGVALITSLIKKIFGNKLSPAFHYYIWIVFALRLIFPFTLESDFSIYNMVGGIYREVFVSIQQTKSAVEIPEDIIQSGTDLFGLQETNIQYANTNTFITKNILDLLLLIYLLGMAASIIIYILNYTKCKHKIIKYCVPANDKDFELLVGIKDYLNIKKNIQLFNGGQSMLIGVFKPIIIIPENCSEKDKSAILTHELLHCKNKDNLTNIILSIMKYIYWFNPFIRCFMRMIKDDMEFLCDARSITALNSTNEDYAKTLYAVSKNKINIKTTSGITHMSAKGKDLINRIKFIFSLKKPSVTASAITIVLMFVLFLTALTSPVVVLAENNESLLGLSETRKIFDEIKDNILISEPPTETIAASEKLSERIYSESAPTEKRIVEIKQLYKEFGLIINDDGSMYYEGHPVRLMYDSVTGVFMSENLNPHRAEGTIDVVPIYNGEVLTGLKIATQEEYDAITSSWGR